MPHKKRLLERLNAIATSLKHRNHTLALLGLGSVGAELERIDAYSDLDFFVIIEEGYEQHFRDDLSWLSDIEPISYAFKNTDHGSKVLFQDGIFCEMAVFSPTELQTAHYAQGRIVWANNSIKDELKTEQFNTPQRRSTDYLIGEALSNLYVGLGRFYRGELLTAQRFIQHHAVDRILELTPHIEKQEEGFKDVFGNERRFEKLYPETAQSLQEFIQGYKKSLESAKAILDWLEQHFELNQSIVDEIRKLLSH